jgi:hypothetical protein
MRLFACTILTIGISQCLARADEGLVLLPVEPLGHPVVEEGDPAPALDLPVSRTGVEVYHPPLYRVTPETGPFRVQPFAAPVSAALLNEAVSVPLVLSMNAANSPAQALADGYRARRDARRPAESAPLRVEFPAVGPSLFLASELTAEDSTPNLEIDYQKEHKGGVK